MTRLLEAPERQRSDPSLALSSDTHVDGRHDTVRRTADDVDAQTALVKCQFWQMVVSVAEEGVLVDEPLELVSLTPDDVRDVLRYTSSEYIMYPVELPPLED